MVNILMENNNIHKNIKYFTFDIVMVNFMH